MHTGIHIHEITNQNRSRVVSRLAWFMWRAPFRSIMQSVATALPPRNKAPIMGQAIQLPMPWGHVAALAYGPSDGFPVRQSL